MTPTTIVPFNFDAHPMRSIVIDGAPWFVAADVCAALHIVKPSQAIETIPEKHKRMQNIGLPGRSPWVVSESGLYRLILRSNKPEAVRFQDWITDEVLPSIRKTSAYGTSLQGEAAFAALRHMHSEADREVERRTQHDYYRPNNARAQEHIARVIEEVAAARGLSPASIAIGFHRSLSHAMAETYGDPVAVARINRQKIDFAAAKPAKRLAAPRRPRSRADLGDLTVPGPPSSITE